MPVTRRFAVLLSLLVLPVFAACASGPPAPAYPSVAGEYTGGISVEGQGINGVLTIDQMEGELSIFFDAPSFGLAAEGDGLVAEDGSARARLSYDLQCPGQAEMVGQFTPEGVFNGTITATDCTGQIGGTFSFRR